MSNECSDCNETPGPGSVVRLVGRDYSGKVIELCSRCFIRRERDRAPAPAAPPPKKASKKASKK